MSNPSWMEQVQTMVETATVSDHYKGGLVNPPTLDKIIEHVKECWEYEMRDGEHHRFEMALYGPDGKYAGRAEFLYCVDRQEAEAVLENILPPDYLAGKRGYEWRLRE